MRSGVMASGLALILVLAGPVGCRSPAGGAPALTLVSARVNDCFLPAREVSASQELAVGPGWLRLTVSLDPAPTQAWLDENLTVAGTGAKITLEDRELLVRFPSGRPGEVMTVRLTDVQEPGGGKTLKLTMRRMDLPTVKAEALEDGAWRGVEDGETLLQVPLELRLVFSRPVDKASAEAALADVISGSRGTCSWPDALTVRLTFREPNGYLLRDVPVDEITDTIGFRVHVTLPAAYIGEPLPPTLFAVDPATLEETRLCTLPIDITRAKISADGSFLVAHVYPTHDPEILEGDLLIADTTSGDFCRLPWADSFFPLDRSVARLGLDWYEVHALDGEVLARGELPRNSNHMSSSPALDRIALLALSPGASSDAEGRRPHDLVLLTPATGRLEVVAEKFVDIQHEGPETWGLEGAPAFDPTGRLIAAVSDVAEGGEIRTVDLTSGETSTAVTVQSSSRRLAIRGFSWSPDGRYWLVSNECLVEAADPHEKRPLPAIRETGQLYETSYWSPDSRWVAWGDGDWSDTKLLNVESGELVNLGVSFLCGWDDDGLLYVIRWSDASNCFYPSFP